MTRSKGDFKAHEFSGLTGFDKAMRKIVGTPKVEVDRREAAARKRRNKRKG